MSSEDALNCSLPSVLGGGDVVLAAVKHLAGEWSADQVVVDVVWWCCFLIVVDSGVVVIVSGSVVPSYNWWLSGGCIIVASHGDVWGASASCCDVVVEVVGVIVVVICELNGCWGPRRSQLSHGRSGNQWWKVLLAVGRQVVVAVKLHA